MIYIQYMIEIIFLRRYASLHLRKTVKNITKLNWVNLYWLWFRPTLFFMNWYYFFKFPVLKTTKIWFYSWSPLSDKDDLICTKEFVEFLILLMRGNEESKIMDSYINERQIIINKMPTKLNLEFELIWNFEVKSWCLTIL
jgi:hypothetical protein